MTEKFTTPITDEIWQTRNGVTRTVVAADTEGYWVTYRRPPPATFEPITVSGRKWSEWVDREGAVRTQKSWRAP